MIDVDIIQDVETFLRNMNGRELLSYAICNEECGAETCDWLTERVGGSVAEEFRRLAAEKRKHAIRMRELFERAYPGTKPIKFNAPPLDALPVCREMLNVKSIEKAIALALLSEAIGRDVYRKLQRMAGKEEAELFGELAEVKENAYNRLLRLYNELME